MKNIILIAIMIVLVYSSSLGKIDHLKSKEIADKFLNYLTQDNSDGMFSMFNEKVKSQLPLDQTKLLWTQISGMFGELKTRGEIRTSDYNDFVMCSSVLTFQKGSLEAKITIDQDSLLAGFFITPVADELNYQIPSYADTTKFVEIKFKFGADPYILDATLTLPKSEVATPVVILVHGSGPHDMDETIGPNKPFKDLAWGLASNQIATFRYTKRTKQYPEKMLENFENEDLYGESIDDAIYAINFLMANAGTYNIDNSKIYVLGHSLGGTVAPTIASKSSNLAGFISLAGMSRRIDKVLLEQYNYLFSIDGEISEEEQQKISELKSQIKVMLSDDLNKSVPADSLPLNMPAKYWMTFKTIDPANQAKSLQMKILILQGGRDYQVTLDDYKIWQDALKNNSKAKFKFYENLNHLFQVGTGKSKPEEYYSPAHVDERVINDISIWIKE